MTRFESSFSTPSSCPHRWLALAMAVVLVSISACAPEPTPTETAYPTSMAPCFPKSVFTADELQARVACHPEDTRIEITPDTVVLFAFPDPLLDWAGPIFIVHIPSVSEVVLDIEGTLMAENYNSSEGRDAIAAVLNDQDLIAQILERAQESGE